MTASDPEPQDGRIARAGRRRAATRLALIQSARRLFGRRGYHDVTPQAIAAAAGVSRATFYRFFDNKTELFAAVLDDLLGQLHGAIRGVELDAGSPPPEQQLLDNLHRILDVLLEHPELIRLLLVEAIGRDARLGGRVEGLLGHILTMLESSLSEGRQAGLVRDLDPHIGAVALLGAVKEVLARILPPGLTEPDADERQRIAVELVAIALRGVGSADFLGRLRPNRGQPLRTGAAEAAMLDTPPTPEAP